MAPQSRPPADEVLADALAHLEKLIAFDTTSALSNLALIDWAAGLLAASGARLRYTFDDGKTKANLLATIGPDVAGGVVLSGHTDVVPVEGQAWTSDPFRLARRGVRLFGRGTADMKGFIAACLAIAPLAAASALQRPIHFALSYDEEVGCLGVPRLVDDMKESLPTPAFAIVGEPTMMQLVTAHKGCCVFETRFVGRAAHSSLAHFGVSASVHAAAFVTYLDELLGPGRSPASRIQGLMPAHTTFNVGVFESGTAMNIIPRDARLAWEYRAIPELDTDAFTASLMAHLDEIVLPKMQRVFPEAAINTTKLAHVPVLDPRLNRELLALLTEIGGFDGETAVAFGTEAGFFQAAGVPAIVCGPGSIEVAHRADEYVDCDQIGQATVFLRKIVDWAAT
jgi:acetylornithine deacetylase